MQDKILLAVICVMIACVVAGSTLYICIGHKLIEAMYRGESAGILNDIIKGQATHSLGYYFEYADKMFLRSNIYFCAVIIFVLALIRIVKYEEDRLAGIFVLTVLILGCHAVYFGVVMTPDSYTYSKWADVLIINNLNIIDYQKIPTYSPISFLYIGFVGLVAMAKIVAGSYWPQLIVVINVIFGAILAVILADLVYVFTKSKLSVWVIFILYAFNPDILHWTRHVLSDASYMFLNFLTFYFIAMAFLAKNSRKTGYWAVILFIFLVNIFYRPTAIVMIPIILFAFYLYNRKKDMRWKPFFVFLAFFIAASIFIHAAIIKNIWSLQHGKSVLRDTAVFFYQTGAVIYGRPYTYHNAPSALLDYVFITADKFVHYFYFSDRLFGSIPKLISCFFFVPLYVLFTLGVVFAAEERDNSIIKSLTILSVIVIIAYSLFHSMTLIDNDWRYRLPVLPYMLFVSGLGVKFLIQMYKGNEGAEV